MDPEEWERQADHIAAALNAEVSGLEADFWPHPPAVSFRNFWQRVRDLNERVRKAPAIKLDDKLSLQRRLNELCQRARHDQKVIREQAGEIRAELLDALNLSRESADDSSSIAEIQQVRADLVAIRERISNSATPLAREDRQLVWETWQSTNQVAWARLEEMWHANEEVLATFLQSAAERLDANDARGAKDAIKAFHAGVQSHEASHQALRRLRTTANELWSRADELSQKKRADYLQFAGRRLHQWRHEQAEKERLRAQIATEIEDLDRRIAAATTDLAAALLRGQIEERRKALAEAESAERELVRQIESTEVALSQS